jgi:hypothetical protein
VGAGDGAPPVRDYHDEGATLRRMSKRDDALGHLPFALTHVDGLVWLCDLLAQGGDPSGPVMIVAGGRVLIGWPTFLHLRRGILEAGQINCRKLLDFLGLRVTWDGATLIERSEEPTRDNMGIEDLRLGRIGLGALAGSPFGTEVEVTEACRHTIRHANKGGAHMAEYVEGELARVGPVRTCALAVRWLVEEHVYKALKIDVPPYRVWTAP